ncbi:hypothetical protein Tco_1363804 [Tanacetum coccineum]
MLKGCPVFLANINTKVTEDKSEKKRLEDVPIIQDFPDVFPKGLSGLLLTRQVEFQIDLIPGVAPVAQALIKVDNIKKTRKPSQNDKTEAWNRKRQAKSKPKSKMSNHSQ